MAREARMHQTTVRFTADLWSQLELEAKRSGVSAAQYVRDATLARLAYTAGRRGDLPFGASALTEPPPRTMRDNAEESTAVWEQARLARARARTLRKDAQDKQTALGRGRAERPPMGVAWVAR